MTTGENSSTMNGNVRSGGHTVEEKYMNIIKAVNLVFDYIRRDEEGQVEEVLPYLGVERGETVTAEPG